MSKVLIFIVAISVLSAGIPAIALYAAGETGGALMAIGIGVGTFAFIWFLFLRGMVRQGRVLRTGEPATALINDVSDTGVTINDNPVVKLHLEVQPRRGAKFHTTTKVTVSRLNPGVYRPGMSIEVKVDPKDSTYVAVDPRGNVKTGGNPFAGEGLSPGIEEKRARAVEKVLRENDELYKELAVSGERCKGTILNAWPLGVNVDDDAVAMEFMVEAEIPGVETFTVELKAVIKNENVFKFVPGRKVHLFYDPEDVEGRIVIGGSAE